MIKKKREKELQDGYSFAPTTKAHGLYTLFMCVA
jgi:hypothetical protein